MVEVDPDEIRALLAVARLDMEAAEAYQIAAGEAEDAPLQRMLTSFADDHRRHVDDLVDFARRHHVDVEVKPLDPGGSVLVALASTVGGLDPAAAVEALIANELLTNATYETVSWLVSDEEALAIVERNGKDEVRHLEALTRYAAEHAGEET
jgi:rubrerythrin